MKTVAIVGQKGGCGKTTTAAAIGEGLKRDGAKVLFVDCDPQANLSYLMGADVSGLATPSTLDVLQRASTAADAIQHTDAGDIIAASPTLAGADITITQTGKEYRLKEALETLTGAYNFVVVDTAPALGIATINALTACDGCVIPSGPDFFSLQGIGQLRSTIDIVRQYCNRDLKVYGIVITRYNSRAVIGREVAAMLEETATAMKTRLFDSRIRECTAVKEAQAMQQSIYSYAPRSNAATDYTALLTELKTEMGV